MQHMRLLGYRVWPIAKALREAPQTPSVDGN